MSQTPSPPGLLSETDLRRLVGDRTVAITGASRGLGLGMAERLAGLGARLALCARSPIPLSGDRIHTATVDVSHPTEVDAFALSAEDAVGPIELWINNAGVLGPIGPLRDLDMDDVERHLAVNVTGVFAGSRAFVRLVRDRSGTGVLVNITSGAAVNARAGWTPYCAGKAAVDLMSEALALEEADRGVRVYAVAPGVVDTAMQEQIRGTDPADFPSVDRFHELKASDAFNTPAWVADRIAEIAFSAPHHPGETVVRVPDQPR